MNDNTIQHPVVRSSTLLSAIIGKLPAKRRPFGGLVSFGEDVHAVQIAIPDGNVATFLQERLTRFGTSIQTSFSDQPHLDSAIIQVAGELAKVAQRLVSSLNADKAFAIACEYVVQACSVTAGQIQPFNKYLTQAIELRQAYKIWNGAANAYSGEALDGEFHAIAQYFDDAVEARETIERICRSNQHLGALRTTLQTRPIADEAAWKCFKAVPQRQRATVYQLLLARIVATGDDRVSAENIAQAQAQIAGHQLLAAGTMSGVDAPTAVNALADNPFGRGMSNGGREATAHGMSAALLGRRIAGMAATAEVKVTTEEGGGIVTVTAKLRDVGARGHRNSPSFAQTAVVVAPWATPRRATDQQAQA